MKKAFTIVELLVVIGIIALLMGVLIISFSGGMESARSAKCLSHLKHLATAVNSCAMTTGWYPLAGSIEIFAFDESGGVNNIKDIFGERRGWISWNSQGAYKSKPTSHVANSGWFTSAYEQEVEAREYCLTNGALWKYVSGNREVYVCPVHNLEMAKDRKPAWSYVMNSIFGYDYTKGSDACEGSAIGYGHLDRADRTLLFAELIWAQPDSSAPTPQIDASAGFKNDCTLQYDDDSKESMGFNHRDGRDWVAHVIFADGHVEKLRRPKKGMSNEDMRELTKWLCEGKDVSFNGQRYEELKN